MGALASIFRYLNDEMFSDGSHSVYRGQKVPELLLYIKQCFLQFLLLSSHVAFHCLLQKFESNPSLHLSALFFVQVLSADRHYTTESTFRATL